MFLLSICSCCRTYAWTNLDNAKGTGFRLKAEKRGILEKEGDPRKKGDPRTRGILASPDGRAKGDHRKQGNSRGITASPEGVLHFYSYGLIPMTDG